MKPPLTPPRTLLNRISTRKFDSDNPNCIVEKHVSSSTTSPQAHITFRRAQPRADRGGSDAVLTGHYRCTVGDDKVVTFSTEKIAFDDLVGRISKHCNRLDMKA